MKEGLFCYSIALLILIGQFSIKRSIFPKMSLNSSYSYSVEVKLYFFSKESISFCSKMIKHIFTLSFEHKFSIGWFIFDMNLVGLVLAFDLLLYRTLILEIFVFFDWLEDLLINLISSVFVKGFLGFDFVIFDNELKLLNSSFCVI